MRAHPTIRCNGSSGEKAPHWTKTSDFPFYRSPPFQTVVHIRADGAIQTSFVSFGNDQEAKSAASACREGIDRYLITCVSNAD